MINNVSSWCCITMLPFIVGTCHDWWVIIKEASLSTVGHNIGEAVFGGEIVTLSQMNHIGARKTYHIICMHISTFLLFITYALSIHCLGRCNWLKRKRRIAWRLESSLESWRVGQPFFLLSVLKWKQSGWEAFPKSTDVPGFRLIGVASRDPDSAGDWWDPWPPTKWASLGESRSLQ